MGSILVIEDERVVLNVIETALTQFGHRVEVAEDGREGIRKFEEGRFDVVITDLIMPNVDGNAVVRHIRNSKRKWTPIIGMSGTPWLVNKSGVDKILTKPFPLKRLLDAIEHLSAATIN
ncbi:MAG: response regulator [Deltaproteobacteria bacterium]|nr:response regulator [Deltaproteobacteria bacterium]